MSNQTRERVVALLSFSDGTQASDLLNVNLTNTNLIAALARAVLPAPEGQGYKLLITSVRTDHSDDSALGPHGHAHGFAVDCWPQDESQLAAFVQDLCTNNTEVTKVGLGGKAQGLTPTAGSTIVFNDNATDHIHIQVGGGSI